MSPAGGVRQGGSTLTQQLAKTSFLSSDRSYKRKAQEVIIAFWLEAWLTKDEILSRYLSSVYFGDGVYGLRAAARHYFDRAPEKLTLAQSAMLAGMVQAPSRLAPTRNLAGRAEAQPAGAAGNGRHRRDHARRARARPARRGPGAPPAKVPTGTYFADWVAPGAQKAFEADFGEVKVPTTLDADLQRLAVRAISNARIGDAQAAMVAMRPDGRVVAMVGGKSYKASPFNRATQARRQPGSAFKLFVYLAALARRLLARRHDRRSGRSRSTAGPRPTATASIAATITLREAFARSSNAAAVRLSERVGRDNVHARRARARHHLALADSPSVALGTAGVSLLELTAAYAAIASGRYPVRAARPAARRARMMASPVSSQRGGTLDRRRDWAPMLDLLWAAANEGHRPPRRAQRPDLRQDRHDAEQSRRAVHRLCRRPGGRRVGRPRRQQVARQDDRRHRPGADLAQLHGPGGGDRRAARSRPAVPWSSYCAAGTQTLAKPNPRGVVRTRRGDPRSDRRARRIDQSTRSPIPCSKFLYGERAGKAPF